MPENNQILSVEGQLVGMPLAGPESFSQQQLDYLARALGVDETVLWEGEGTGSNFPITLSESITNFDRIRVYVKWHPTLAAAYQSIEYLVSSANDVWQGMLSAILDANSFYQSFFTLTVSNGTSVAYTYGRLRSNYAAAQTNEKQATFCKIVGIHRISGGN